LWGTFEAVFGAFHALLGFRVYIKLRRAFGDFLFFEKIGESAGGVSGALEAFVFFSVVEHCTLFADIRNIIFT
jgi:hypothetical protein